MGSRNDRKYMTIRLSNHSEHVGESLLKPDTSQHTMQHDDKRACFALSVKEHFLLAVMIDGMQ